MNSKLCGVLLLMNGEKMIKGWIKKLLAYIVYKLYRCNILKSKIKVRTIEETIKELQTTQKSMVRFGDGEITMIRGRSLKLQEVKPEIIEMLKRVLGYQYDEMIVTIPEIFDDLSIYRKESELFWQEHLFFSRKIYNRYCNIEKIYYNTSVSRFYYALKDKSKCEEWIEGIKQIWKEKDVVIVEGERTHNGVTNDLLDTAKTVERIIGPASGAYEKVDEIFNYCCKYPKDRLFLISLGVAAKALTEKMFLEGYRVLDIGNLDMEYEWFLMKAKNKVKIPKHEVVGEEANRKAGYEKYLNEIKVMIES